MLMNNLDPEVAERPEDLVVYGGTGKAARNWESFDAIVRSLRSLEAAQWRKDYAPKRSSILPVWFSPDIRPMSPRFCSPPIWSPFLPAKRDREL